MSTHATFVIEITPTEPVLPATSRFDFAKVWTGDVDGVSKGVMMSSGDPASGTAGYVAMEVFEGSLAGRTGSVAFAQYGSMRGGTQELRYEIVPGSGTDDLADLSGTLDLNIDDDGVHHITFNLG